MNMIRIRTIPKRALQTAIRRGPIWSLQGARILSSDVNNSHWPVRELNSTFMTLTKFDLRNGAIQENGNLVRIELSTYCEKHA